MKRDEVLAIFPEATEEQLKSLMDLNGRDINLEKAKRTANKEEIERLKLIEAEYEELKGVNQTAEEKLQKALEKAAEKEKEFALKINKADAISILVEAGFTEAEYSTFIDDIVSSDSERTKRIATSYATTRKTVAEATEKGVKASLLQGMTPPPAGGNGGATLTREQFEKMGYAERLLLKQNSPDTYKQLTTGGN
jgi:hypothetical protein